MLEILKLSPLFAGLSFHEINLLISKVPHQIKTFSGNEVVALSGESVEKAMILVEGKLVGEMVDYAGNTLKIEEIEPPQMVAPAFLYGPQSFFPVNLSALTDAKVLIMFKKDFTQLLSADQRILINYLNIISGKVQFLSQKITFLSFKTIREKLSNYLLNHSTSGSATLFLKQSQKGLAGMFGVARPSLARTIHEMEMDGIIRWERNQVTILNFESLRLILGR